MRCVFELVEVSDGTNDRLGGVATQWLHAVRGAVFELPDELRPRQGPFGRPGGLVVLPLATMVPALAALALVTAVWLALHAYELVWWREARAESRSVLASPESTAT